MKLLEGNPGHQKLNRNEPRLAEGIRSRPEWLLPEAKREWVRVCGDLERAGVLAAVDRGVLASYCQNWARWVACEQYLTEHGTVQVIKSKANGTYEQQRPQVAMGQKYNQLMMAAAAKLGISPADRSKISTPEKREDELDALLG